MKRIYDDHLSQFQRSGCVIEHMAYARNPEEGGWRLALILTLPAAIGGQPCRVGSV